MYHNTHPIPDSDDDGVPFAIPAKFWLLALTVFVLAGCFWFGWQFGMEWTK